MGGSCIVATDMWPDRSSRFLNRGIYQETGGSGASPLTGGRGFFAPDGGLPTGPPAPFAPLQRSVNLATIATIAPQLVLEASSRHVAIPSRLVYRYLTGTLQNPLVTVSTMRPI